MAKYLKTPLHSIHEIIKKRFGDKAKVKFIDQKKSFLQRKLSTSLINTEELIHKVEEKAMWSRFGL